MEWLSILLAAAVALVGGGASGTTEELSCAQLAQLARSCPTNPVAFSLTGVIVHNRGGRLGVDDGTVCIGLAPCDGATNAPGARVRVHGHIVRSPRATVIACDEIDALGQADLPPVRDVSAADFRDGLCDHQLVQLTGLLRDVVADENDPRFSYCILLSDETVVYAAVKRPWVQLGDLRDQIGAQVRIRGFCTPQLTTNRLQIGRTLQFDLEDLATLRPAGDPFAAPVLEELGRIHPAKLPFLGARRISGRVLAVWNDRHVLLRRANGNLSNVELATAATPACGDDIEAAGFLETDLYRVNLTHAVWRKAPNADTSADLPHDVSPRAILYDANGTPKIDPDYHGQLVRFAGTIRSLPGEAEKRYVFLLESDGCLVSIDGDGVQAVAQDLAVGCRVETTGVCVMDTRNWSANDVFPKMNGFTLVLRTPDDLRILERPPWWTPARFWTLIGSLLLVVAGFVVWNLTLRRLAERRGRELSRRELQALRARLKTRERTQLAVELHDAISQNLTGVAMELRTIDCSASRLPDDVRLHLDVANRALGSCRSELRNVLWDLRNNALEQATMNEAIRQTLDPVLGTAALAVRFAVPRHLLADNTAHAILAIVRELAANAVRHGRAEHIRVAGAYADGAVRLSVSDDGTGFDPVAAPGFEQGHFGLLGVRERVESAEGTIDFNSSPGKGTRVTIVFPLKKGQP